MIWEFLEQKFPTGVPLSPKMYNSFEFVQSTLSKPFTEYVKIERSWKYWQSCIDNSETTLLLKPFLAVYAEPSLGIAVIFDETYGAFYLSYHRSTHRASLFRRFSQGESIMVSCIAGFIVSESNL